MRSWGQTWRHRKSLAGERRRNDQHRGDDGDFSLKPCHFKSPPFNAITISDRIGSIATLAAMFVAWVGIALACPPLGTILLVLGFIAWVASR